MIPYIPIPSYTSIPILPSINRLQKKNFPEFFLLGIVDRRMGLVWGHQFVTKSNQNYKLFISSVSFQRINVIVLWWLFNITQSLDNYIISLDFFFVGDIRERLNLNMILDNPCKKLGLHITIGNTWIPALRFFWNRRTNTR